MAIAKAECTCATCGEKFEVRVSKSNSREARSFEIWAAENITECRECQEKRIQAKHDAENAQAAAAAQEMGYPELLGTEKQIAWANTIREKAMALLRDKCLDPDMPENRQYIRLAYQPSKALLLRMRQAGWWIEHRTVGESILALNKALAEIDKPLCETVSAVQKAVYNGEKTMAQAEKEIDALIAAPAQEAPRQPAPQAEEKPARPEAVPETRKHDGSADIRVDGSTVLALYARNDDFMAIVKALGFTWKSGWTLTCGERTGSPENVAAELGSRLLNAGFAVRFDSQEILDKAVSGDYTPMCRRWIRSSSKGFYIEWGKEDDHYRAAKSIPGAAYDAPGVQVPERSWSAVMDFAAKYGYRVTAKAQEALDRLSGAAQLVSPQPAKEPAYQENNVLTSSREVLEDLKDD
ncbi:MAG: hypothetical protein J5556_03415 [Deltaproteobacteria bacterium]|nr:hypothetical protein [Deltaproteobacteria bacterium]